MNKCFVKIIGAVLCAALFVTGAGIDVKAADTNKLTVYSSVDVSTSTAIRKADANIAMASYWKLDTEFTHNTSTNGVGHQTIRPTNTSVLYCIKT